MYERTCSLSCICMHIIYDMQFCKFKAIWCSDRSPFNDLSNFAELNRQMNGNSGNQKDDMDCCFMYFGYVAIVFIVS